MIETESKKNGKEPLSGAFFELNDLESALKTGSEVLNGYEHEAGYLLLIRITLEKLRYYELKYNFQIDEHDHFWAEDLPRLVRESDKLEKEHGAKIAEMEKTGGNGNQATEAIE